MMSLPILSFLEAPNAPQWTTADEVAVVEPFTYTTLTPGKDVRGKMIAAFNEWMDVPSDKLELLVRGINMLHGASLMVDDIEDDSELRRGQPVAHKIFGVPQTINAANYVYFLAFRELLAIGDLPSSPTERDCLASSEQDQWPSEYSRSPSLSQILTDELISLHRGQGLDIVWRDTLSCPTEEEYIGMVVNKTGGLFRLAIRLMMACARRNIHVDYVSLSNLLGLYFQIRDDYLNLAEYDLGKGYAEDLTEAKFSFPIIHAIRSAKESRYILSVLQKRTTSDIIKRQAIAYLRHQTRSFDYTLEVLGAIEIQIKTEIARLGGNAKLEQLLEKLRVR